MRFKTLFLGSLLLVALPLTAQADDRKQKQQELKGTNDTYISLSVENDNLGGGTDRFYTSGIRLTWFDADINVPPMIDTMADRIPTFDLNERTSTFYTIGHNIYTPEDITLANQPQGDRPWAAFLYGSVGMATPTFSNNGDVHHLDELEFTLGIVGPEALGEQTQKFVHKYISDSPKPEGWDNQLEFEPGFIVSWQRRFPYAWEKDFGSVNTRIEPNMSVSLGTIRTNVGVGATLVAGSNRSLDTPPRVRPAVPGTGIFLTDDNTFNWQVFAGIDGRLVGRDIFLDGNTFSSSNEVDKNYLVGDLSTGVSLFYDDYRLSYTLNMRTKEFKNQRNESVFGSLTLTKRF